MKLKFQNVTISGGIAVGKNTLMNNLKPYLEPYGWKFTSGGEIVRSYATENKLPLASLVSDDVHRNIDKRTMNLLTKEGHYVIEAWLAGYMARNLSNTLRILLVCNNDAIRVDRVANRDSLTIHQAKESIRKREEDNFTEWKRLYGDHEFLNPKHFHLVIDTYSSGQMETVGKVLDALGYDHGRIIINKK